jgi:hypothetical protein
MSERIAEFDNADDAWAFRNMKGKLDYDVCGGIHKMYAVMPKLQYATNLGDSFSPPEAMPYREGDDDE